MMMMMFTMMKMYDFFFCVKKQQKISKLNTHFIKRCELVISIFL